MQYPGAAMRVSINEVLRYDIASDRWSRIADLPESMQKAPAVAVRGKIILVGTGTDVMIFDPATTSFPSLAVGVRPVVTSGDLCKMLVTARDAAAIIPKIRG